MASIPRFSHVFQPENPPAPWIPHGRGSAQASQGAWSHRRSPATFQAQAVGHSGDFARVHVEVILGQ